jgi:hypothetical protein
LDGHLPLVPPAPSPPHVTLKLETIISSSLPAIRNTCNLDVTLNLSEKKLSELINIVNYTEETLQAFKRAVYIQSASLFGHNATGCIGPTMLLQFLPESSLTGVVISP